MKTKQLRLSSASEIKNRISQFLGKKINIVLADNTVMFGELKNVNDSGVILKNMRLKKIHYAFNQISEIYFDIIVDA